MGWGALGPALSGREEGVSDFITPMISSILMQPNINISVLRGLTIKDFGFLGYEFILW